MFESWSHKNDAGTPRHDGLGGMSPDENPGRLGRIEQALLDKMDGTKTTFLATVTTETQVDAVKPGAIKIKVEPIRVCELRRVA